MWNCLLLIMVGFSVLPLWKFGSPAFRRRITYKSVLCLDVLSLEDITMLRKVLLFSHPHRFSEFKQTDAAYLNFFPWLDPLRLYCLWKRFALTDPLSPFQGITESFGAAIHALNTTQLTDGVINRSKRMMLDTLGVGLLGTRTAVFNKALKYSQVQ